MKNSRDANKDKFIERDRKWREANPAKRLLYATKQSSKLKNLEHNIDESDLILPEYCPLLGIKIDYTAGTGKTMLKPSVDRIDPKLGYVKGNVEVMSSLANTMKSNASRSLLRVFAKNILLRYPDDSADF